MRRKISELARDAYAPVCHSSSLEKKTHCQETSLEPADGGDGKLASVLSSSALVVVHVIVAW